MALADLQTEYVGKRGRLFRLASWTGLLTVLTLGIYRFWMKTRLRRYYWSAIRPGGQPLEYVGEPLEKLLGFLIAVVFLAFYIGIVNLILMFLSFSLLNNNFAAYAVSVAGVVPIYFYARYRARRYILARTRWRGLRFGVEQGAWGYSWRAVLHWLVTILSLGLLWPRMTFSLEKYRTDRTYYGSEKFVQGGDWKMLYRPFLPFLAGLVIFAAAPILIYQGSEDQGAAIGGLGLVIAAYGMANYSVNSFRILTNRKILGETGFISRPRTLRVVTIYLVGYSIVFAFIILLLGLLVFGITMLVFGTGSVIGEDFDIMETATLLPVWVNTILAVVFYFTVFLGWGVLRQVFVTLPLARHYAETLEITRPAYLTTICQRARDEFTEAEGFAEALDVGAAI